MQVTMTTPFYMQVTMTTPLYIEVRIHVGIMARGYMLVQIKKSAEKEMGY